MTHNRIQFDCCSNGAINKANVQNPLDFVTALFLTNKRTFRLKIGHINREMIEFNRPNRLKF